MPRKGREDTGIPSTIERSDKHAQEIWKETHDNAVETYGSDGERAHRVAYAALKHSYRKVGDHWEKKARKGPSDPQAAKGYSELKREGDPDKTAGGKVVGLEKSKDELYSEAQKLGIAGRSRMNKEELAEAIQAKQ
ncbi:MAG: ChaB family protein [Hyphomicrobiales bacterium]